MNTQVIVKKLGWENASEIISNFWHITTDTMKDKFQVLVVSAMRDDTFNTTSLLIQIGKDCNKWMFNKVLSNIEQIQNFHIQLLKLKCWRNIDLFCSLKKELESITNEFRENILFFINTPRSKLIPSSENDYSFEWINWEVISIIWFWEILSAKIIASSINIGINCSKIRALAIDTSKIIDHQEIIRLSQESNEDISTLSFRTLSSKLWAIVKETLQNWIIPIISGFIWTFPGGIENAVGRGYTDATAAAVSVWLTHLDWAKVVLEIQKSVEGVLSADPRLLKNPTSAKVIREISYISAREITWSRWANAKLLHEQALRPELLEAWISIHLFNPFDWSKWSWIVQQSKNLNSWVEFIWWRKWVHFISISSAKMGKGYLYEVGKILNDYVSIDIISTSETEITFTVDAKAINWNLEEFISELRNRLNLWENTNNNIEFVEIVENQSLIFCIGWNISNISKILATSNNVLYNNWINCEIVSVGRLQRAIVFGVDNQDFEKAINVLHKELIE